jgi:hypothetical protein
VAAVVEEPVTLTEQLVLLEHSQIQVELILMVDLLLGILQLLLITGQLVTQMMDYFIIHKKDLVMVEVEVEQER